MSNYLKVIQDQPQSILVRMPNWVGDLVMATPILTDLRHHWPDAKITVLCREGLGDLIREDPHLNEVVSLSYSKKKKENGITIDLFSLLRQQQYDLGILLTNSFSSAWIFWRGDVKNRLGFNTHWRHLLLNHAIPFPKARQTQHLVLTYKALLQPLGIAISTTAPTLYLTTKEKEDSQIYLTQKGITSSDFIIGINPGAAYGSAKCWLPERFKELTSLLLQHPKIKIIYFGDKSGASLVQEICLGMPEDRVINIAGQTNLRQLMSFIESCHLFLTNDSGPMHMASALKVPLIALFGSTSDVATGPYNGGYVIHKHVACSPCYRRECPIDFRCMKAISVQEVYQEINKRLS